jgi:hypothetical protein
MSSKNHFELSWPLLSSLSKEKIKFDMHFMDQKYLLTLNLKKIAIKSDS